MNTSLAGAGRLVCRNPRAGVAGETGVVNLLQIVQGFGDLNV